jgi:cell division protein FtsQ
VVIVTAVLLVLGGLVWAALKSPWATVRRIEVTGTDRIPVAQVRSEAEPEIGHPMLLARTGDIAARVSRQRLVRSVRVQRLWSGTIRVQVEERVPVAALPAGPALALVDRDGVVIEQVRTRPAGLPRLQVGLGEAQVPALRGCLEVLRALPLALSQRLLSIGADSPDGIWLKLRDGRLPGGTRVEWGDSAQTPRKARVLTALLAQHAVAYDVRSPDTPAVRRK